MRRIIIAFALILALQGPSSRQLHAGATGAETKSIAVQPGDTLSIAGDNGKIRLRTWEGATVMAKLARALPEGAGKSSTEIAFTRNGTTVSLNAPLDGATGELLTLEIYLPKFMNVTITGVNPEVDISGIQGLVRVQSASGRITAEDLASTASLITDKGDIIYRMNAQPQGDVRLESTSGNVYCDLVNQLNLRSWIRAGGKISWDMDPVLQSSTLEKQLGSAGPLLYAGSIQGNVVVRLKPPLTLPKPHTPIQTGVSDEAVVRKPEALPATPKPPEPVKTAPAPAAQIKDAHGDSVPREERQPSASTPAQAARRDPSPSEGPRPEKTQIEYALKVNVDSVFLNASVRDRTTNRSIAGLQKKDFLVYEAGVQQEIAQFLPSEAPFNLLLLIDVSGSTRSFLRMMKEAAIDFTRQIKASDRVAIATFNHNVQLIENFTNDRAVAERAIQRIQSGGGTAFYDALMTCLDRYMRGIQGRSAIVVFTDGVDNQIDGDRALGSHTTYDELYRRVQESETIIYTIFLNTEGQYPTTARGPSRGTRTIGGWPGGGRRGGGFPGSFPLPLPLPNPTPSPNPSPNPFPRRQEQAAIYEEAREQLLTIAEQTGGRMYSPSRIDELSGVYKEIADDLRVQYQLGYNSTNISRDGQWREIRLKIENHPEAVVRTRKGYYARKDSA